MKFINYLENITGVDVYALTSFMIFFLFFLAVTCWAILADRKMIDLLSRIPLDDADKTATHV